MTRDSKVSLAALITSIAGIAGIEAANRMERNTPACAASMRATYNNSAGQQEYRDGAISFTEVYPVGQDQALLASPSGQNCMYNQPKFTN